MKNSRVFANARDYSRMLGSIIYWTNATVEATQFWPRAHKTITNTGGKMNATSGGNMIIKDLCRRRTDGKYRGPNMTPTVDGGRNTARFQSRAQNKTVEERPVQPRTQTSSCDGRKTNIAAGEETIISN